MFRKIIVFAAQKFPFTGNIYRYIILVYHWIIPIKKSYSQHSEDKEIYVILKDKLKKSDISFIDVGGNHPTRINNTYLFYRKGYKGIILEPNIIYKKMYKLCRNRDVFLPYGCADKCDLLKFVYSPTPVLSSFNQDRFDTKLTENRQKTEYLPVFPLYLVIEKIGINQKYIPLLSIDTEGFNQKVLKGAESILNKVISVLVEFDSDRDKFEITKFLKEYSFVLLKQYGCNLYFINKKFLKNL